MPEFIDKDGYSLVSLIIPQVKLQQCLNAIFANWPYKAIHFNCRGTMVSEHWFQAFLPNLNPEMEYFQYVVSERDVEAFMAFCVDVNDLHLPGSGAIFSSHLDQLTNTASADLFVHHAPGTAVSSTSKDNEGADKAPVKFKTNLYAIYGLLQSSRTEQAIKEAMQAGSHGPIVYFVEGRGTRDKAGWLKITKKPYEEVVMLLVEDIDRENVLDALVSAGNVGSVGSGVVFDMPIASGLINLPTSVSANNNRASNEQMTAAIDQLMGNTDWRNSRSLSSLVDSLNGAEPQAADKPETILLNALVPRKISNQFLDQILAIGIPGANVIYAKTFIKDNAKNSQGFKVHQELVQIRMVVPKTECEHYQTALQNFAARQGYKDVVIYQLGLSRVVRYQLKQKEDKAFMYRGGKLD